jgi:hypothetical protein
MKLIGLLLSSMLSYSSTNIISMIKSLKLTLAGHVAYTRNIRNAYTILVEKSDGKRLQETQSYTRGKIKLSLCFNWAPRHEGVLGSGGIAHRILDLGTRWGVWSASCPGRFTPRERAPGTHGIGGWVGRRAVLDAEVKRKILSPCRDSNPRSFSP